MAYTQARLVAAFGKRSAMKRVRERMKKGQHSREPERGNVSRWRANTHACGRTAILGVKRLRKDQLLAAQETERLNSVL